MTKTPNTLTTVRRRILVVGKSLMSSDNQHTTHQHCRNDGDNHNHGALLMSVWRRVVRTYVEGERWIGRRFVKVSFQFLSERHNGSLPLCRSR